MLALQRIATSTQDNRLRRQDIWMQFPTKFLVKAKTMELESFVAPREEALEAAVDTDKDIKMDNELDPL